MGDSLYIVKTADQNVKGTTLANDNELQFHAEANTTWGIHFDLINSADDVDDLNGRVKMAIFAPSDATATVYCMTCVDDGLNDIINGAEVQGPLTPASQGTPGSTFAWGAPGAGANPAYSWVRIAAKVAMGSTPGQVGLQFAEYASVADTDGTTVYAGSSLIAQRNT